MRVCIDGTPLLVRSAGVKTYLYHWIRSLTRHAGRESVGVFPFLNSLGRLDHERPTGSRPAAILRLGLLHFANLRRNPALDWMTAGFDLFHATNLVRNPPRKKMLTTTIHDLTSWIMPEMHRPQTIQCDKAFARAVVSRADGVIAVSQNSKQDAIRLLGVPAEKIEVIYHGVAQAYFEAGDAEIAAAKAKYDLPASYVLFVGTIEPRKNLDILLQAHGELKPSLREDFPVVVAGPVGWSSRDMAGRLRESASYLGYVPEEDLPGLTAGAALCVYPSFYEGFGLPVAQALATGTPVLTSNVSALPEVAGDAGLLVDPRSVEDVKTGIERFLLSPTLQEELAAASRRRANLFRWEAAAEKSWDFFERICGR